MTMKECPSVLQNFIGKSFVTWIKLKSSFLLCVTTVCHYVRSAGVVSKLLRTCMV